jgi:hypothetical protein
MTGNAIKQRELSSEELDAVSGGSIVSILGGFMASLTNALQQQQQGAEGAQGAQSGGQNFQQILQQMTQG